MSDTSLSAGAKRRRRAQGVKADALQADLAGLDVGIAEWADDFIFGQVWGRPGLEQHDRMLIAITALASLGRTAQLRNYLFGAVQDGVPAAKIHEALVMLVVYAGFPVALTALAEWRSVRDACERNGISLT
jgi:4-carboxymuconolactone decarboxylase